MESTDYGFFFVFILDLFSHYLLWVTFSLKQQGAGAQSLLRAQRQQCT